MENETKTVEKEATPAASGSKVWFYSKKVIRTLCFFLVIVILLLCSGFALKPKNNSHKDGVIYELSWGFLAEPANSIDVFFAGNSDNFASFSPIEMWRAYGFQSYTSGFGRERVMDVYYYLQDMLKTQHPKVVVLETDCIFYNIGRAEVIGGAVERMLYRYMPVFEYHDRWKDVKWEDMFRMPEYTWRSHTHGQRASAEVTPFEGERKIVPSDKVASIDKVSFFYLEAICKLCKDHDIDLVFAYVPCIKAWTYAKHNGIQKFADEHGIEFIDYNLMEKEIGLDWTNDTRDKGTHMNVYGAKKVSLHIGRYLADKYQFKDLRSDAALSKSWANDYQYYLKEIQESKNKPEVKDKSESKDTSGAQGKSESKK